ncbi:MAG: lectin like domain-containing protein [Methanobacteriota archaeon]
MRIQSIIQIIALVGLLIWGIQIVSAVGETTESSLKFSVPPLNPDYVSSVQLQKTGSEEYATGFVPPPVSFDHLAGKEMQDVVAMDTYPAKYDLRTENKLTPIRNQNIWGTCWSFAALGSLESNLKPGQTFDLSEKNVVNRNLWLTGPDTGGNYLKSGGYLLGWLGAVDESTDPYPSGVWNYSSPTGPVTAHVQNILWIPPMANATDLNNIKSAITTYGAMQSSFFWTDSNYNSSSRGYYCPTCTSSNHAIDLVGWDDGYSRFNFTSHAPGDGAFLFRNSWGTGWGDQGYGWMSYYEPTIGKYNAEFLGSDLNAYSGIYQYDPAGMSSNLGAGSSNLWGGNIFNVSSNATLSAVGFYTNDIPATYDFRIYKNPSTGGPLGATIISQKTGTVPMSGYHTIPLDTPVNLWVGEQFSVVLHITNSGYNYPIAIEYPPNGPAGNTWNASLGQGYISSNGNSWTDLVTIPGYTNTSICIKGYTTPQVPLELYT